MKRDLPLLLNDKLQMILEFLQMIIDRQNCKLTKIGII